MGPLTIGLNGGLHVREERLSAHSEPCRLMYISDLHLRRGRSEGLCRQVIECVRSRGPDALLLGGDMVDGPSELPVLAGLVKELRRSARVLAVAGNHDGWVGLERVRNAIASGGGEWIHDGVAQVPHGRRVIGVCGPESASVPGGDVRVLCAHDPRVWASARHRGYDLVLAGHLHGCQFVALKFRDHLYPGALFYRFCCLAGQHHSAHLVVSRGVSDLIPIRWGCPREVVLCCV